jgi:integrase
MLMPWPASSRPMPRPTMPTLRKDNRHQTKARINGKLVYFYGSTPEEAQAKKTEALSIKNGPTFSNAPTFSQFVVQVWEPNVRDRLKPQSRIKYNGQLTNHILPVFGNVPIKDIDLGRMMALKNSLRNRGHGADPKNPPPLGARETYQVLALTKQILEFARKAGVTRREDWKLLGMPKYPKKKKREAFAKDLTSTLIDKAAELGMEWMIGPIWCAAVLGLRRGEIAGLYKIDLDRKDYRLSISRQRQRIKGVGTVDRDTKSETSDRELHLTKRLADLLWSYRSEHPIYMFAGAFGHPIKPDRITEAFIKLRSECGLSAKLTFHDLRSYAASNLRKLKVDLEVIMLILGQSKIDMTVLYIELEQAQKATAIKKLDRSLKGKG